MAQVQDVPDAAELLQYLRRFRAQHVLRRIEQRRIEIAGRRPWIIVDAAHNPVSARALAEAIRRVPPRRRTILVFGASADKNYAAMLRTLEPLADLTIFTRARSPRAAATEMLARRARGAAVRTESVGQALALARTVARPADAIVVAGSFYVAGEALSSLSGRI